MEGMTVQNSHQAHAVTDRLSMVIVTYKRQELLQELCDSIKGLDL